MGSNGQKIAASPVLEHLPAIIEDLRNQARDIIGRSSHPCLGYSGGAESSLLLNIFQPFRDRLTVLWVASSPLPHMYDFVHKATQGWTLAVVRADPMATIAEHGIPSTILTTDSALVGRLDPDKPTQGPLLTTFQQCCWMTRDAAAIRWESENGVDLKIHGQRAGEGSGVFNDDFPRHCTFWGPLRYWTRADVMAAIEAFGIELPEQYAEYEADSLECSFCPAPISAERLAYLKRRYPVHHAKTLEFIRLIADAVGPQAQHYRELSA